ncbi:hypothetical protein Hte_009503 [Hypoxylon texense]
MSATHSHATRKPNAEHVEHAQHVKTRSSTNQRDSRIPPPSKAANHGQQQPAGQNPIDVALSRHANLGPGRRRMSVPGPDENATAARVTATAARTRRSPVHEKHGLTGSAAGDNGASRSANRVPIPEKSELRNKRRSVDAARSKQAPASVPQDQPKEAVSRDESGTTTAYEPGYMLRQNAEFFDVDQDGIVWPRDTYTGCRKLGWGIASSAMAMIALHSILSYPTNPGPIPDLFSRIYYDVSHNSSSSKRDSNAEKRSSTSHSEVCESLLTKYDVSGKGGLDFHDVRRLWTEQKSEHGTYSWCASVIEWLALFFFLWPGDGILPAPDLRAALDGSVLYKQAAERRRSVDASGKRQGEGGTRRRGEAGGASGAVSDPAKLAAAALVTAAVLVWAYRNLTWNSPGWARYWWENYDDGGNSNNNNNKDNHGRTGASWTNPKLFGNW